MFMKDHIFKLWQKKKINKIWLKGFEYGHLDFEKMTVRQILWHLYHKIDDIPTCHYEKCDTEVKWNIDKSPNLQSGNYLKYCSTKCANNDNKQKREQTMLERYGAKYSMQSEEIKEKIQQTNIKRYGGASPFQSKEVQKKSKQTMGDNYGNRPKAKLTNLKRYGVSNPSQKNYSKEQKEILFDETEFTEFMKGKCISNAAKILKIDNSTIQSYIQKYHVYDYISGKSYIENEMKELLKKNEINFLQNTRKIIPPLELDFYLPDYQIAIEMNGDYWHSDQKLLERTGMTSDEYHQMKTDRCLEQGIDLIHISESEWNIWK